MFPKHCQPFFVAVVAPINLLAGQNTRVALCSVFTYNAASLFKFLPEITKHSCFELERIESIFHYTESALGIVNSNSKEDGLSCSWLLPDFI